MYNTRANIIQVCIIEVTAVSSGDWILLETKMTDKDQEEG